MNKYFNLYNFRPRRLLRGIFSYVRYLGYIKPFLASVAQDQYALKRSVLKPYWEHTKLSVPCGKIILALSPHPDDESIGAGGLLWAHKDVSEIHFVAMSRGEKGGSLGGQITDENILAQTRKNEFETTARMLNARSINYFDHPDENVPCTAQAALSLRSLIDTIKPDVVLLPWFFDDLPDHRATNILYAWACSHLDALVLAYEVWTLLEPNAIFDISSHIEAKLSLIKNYQSQLNTVDYIQYSNALASIRAFQYPVANDRGGAVEAFISLPNREYCDLVTSLYGSFDKFKIHSK